MEMLFYKAGKAHCNFELSMNKASTDTWKCYLIYIIYLFESIFMN